MNDDPRLPEARSTLRLTRHLRAPRQRVFDAISRAELLRQWLCPEGFTNPAVEADLRVGGHYRITFRSPEGEIKYVGGVYREVRPPERLVFTWVWEPENDLAGVETVVAIELAVHGDETMLIMTHTGLPTDAARERHAWGWNGAFDHLAALVDRSAAS